MSKKQLQRERAAKRAARGEPEVPGFASWREQKLVERITKRKLPPGQSFPLGFEQIRDGIGADLLYRFSIYFSKGPRMNYDIHLLDVTWREGDPFGPRHSPCHIAVHGVPSQHREALSEHLCRHALPYIAGWIRDQDTGQVGTPIRQLRVRYEDKGPGDEGGLSIAAKSHADRWKWFLLLRVNEVHLPGREEYEE